jgi:hypothetical protein
MGVRLVLDQGIHETPPQPCATSDTNACTWVKLACRKPPMMRYLSGPDRDSVVVTLDADFHTILAVSGARGPSVIRLRMEGLRAPEVVGLIQKVFVEFGTDLKRGSLVTVKAHKITCHRPPICGDD